MTKLVWMKNLKKLKLSDGAIAYLSSLSSFSSDDDNYDKNLNDELKFLEYIKLLIEFGKYLIKYL